MVHNVRGQQYWNKLDGPTFTEIRFAYMTKIGHIFAQAENGNLYYSMDKGQSWIDGQVGLSKFNPDTIYQDYLVESPSGVIYMLRNNNFYEFDNNKLEWLFKSNSNNIGNIQNFRVSDNGTIYAYFRLAGEGVIYNSIDQGKTFIKLLDFNIASNPDFIVGQIDQNYVINLYNIYKFNDDGTNLKNINFNLKFTKYTKIKNTDKVIIIGEKETNILDTKLETIVNLKIDPKISIKEVLQLSNGKLIAFCTDSLGRDINYFSLDEGSNWIVDTIYTAVHTQEFYNYYDRLSTSDQNDILMRVNQNVYLFDSTGKASLLELPLKTNKSIGYDYIKQYGKENIIVRIPGSGQISSTHLSLDDGKSWNVIGRDTNDLEKNIIYSIQPFSDGTLIGTKSEDILTSIDNGNTWTTSVNRWNKKNYGSPFIDSKENIHVLSIDSGYISNDKCVTWSSYLFKNPSSQILGTRFNIRDSLLIIYDQVNKVFISKDLGQNWDSLIFKQTTLIYDVTISKNKNIYILLYYFNEPSNSIVYSKDLGKSFDTLKNIPHYFSIDDNDIIYNLNYENSTIDIYKFDTKLSSYPINELIDYNIYESLVITKGNNNHIYAGRSEDVVYKSKDTFNFITGLFTSKTIKDLNQNCIKDPLETKPWIGDMKFSNSINSYGINTAPKGDIVVYPEIGNYSLTIEDPLNIWELCDDLSNIQIAKDSNYTYKDILIKSKENCVSIDFNISTQNMRPCFDNNIIYVNVNNLGTIDATNIKLKINLGPLLKVISCSANNYSVIGNEMTIDLDLIPSGESILISIVHKLDCKAKLGESLCITGEVLFKDPCKLHNDSNNVKTTCAIIRGAFDPNDKTALVNGKELNSFVPPNNLITYQIRFQNTGNDTAFNVFIKDTLDSNLDWSTFKFIASSHPATYSLTDSRILRFDFPEIYLPDSNANEIASHGFVIYSIEQKPQIKIGNKIKNKAYIYFDFNDPVLTNEVTLEVQEPVSTSHVNKKITNIRAVPNPFTDRTQLILPLEYNSGIKEVKLINMNGTEIFSNKTNTGIIEIENLNYIPGMYTVRIKNSNGETGIFKLIIY